MAYEIARLRDASTDQVMHMMLGDDDDIVYGEDDELSGLDRMKIRRIVSTVQQAGGTADLEILGRMSEGMDVSDFDMMPKYRREMTVNHAEGPAGDELDILSGDDEPEAFEAPAPEMFPILKRAMKHFDAAEPRERVVRIDNENTYRDYVCEKAIKEIERRVNELRAAVEQHVADGHGGKREALRQWDEVLGTSDAIADLSSAPTTDEALAKMPQVPLDLPLFAQGKVRCWRDGDCVICSIQFQAADGTGRIATMATKPKIDTADVAGWALRSGIHPVDVLGALPDLAAVAAGKRLVRDVAGAALGAQRRLDVCGMEDEPIVLATGPRKRSAPIAAVMHLQQRAAAGDRGAQRELALLQTAAQTPAGRQIAAPLLAEAQARLDQGRMQKQQGWWDTIKGWFA